MEQFAAGIVAVLASLPLAVLAAAKHAQEFDFEGTVWRSLFNEERRQTYFYNTKTGQSQWTDPRRAASSGGDTFLTFMIFMLPFLTLVIAGGAYLLYIKMAYPDALKPPKKSKKGSLHPLAAKH